MRSMPPPTSRYARRVLVRHPLQPFDVRNVEAWGAGPGPALQLRPDGTQRRAGDDRRARRAATVRHRPADPADTDADVSLADLVGFSGTRARLLPRLDYTFPAEVEGIDDAMPWRSIRCAQSGRRGTHAAGHPARHAPRPGTTGGMVPRHAPRAVGLAQGQGDPRTVRPVGRDGVTAAERPGPGRRRRHRPRPGPAA